MKIVMLSLIFFGLILSSCSSKVTAEEKPTSEIDIYNEKAQKLGEHYILLVYHDLEANDAQQLQSAARTYGYDTSSVGYKEEYRRAKLHSEKHARIADSILKEMYTLRDEIPNLAIPQLSNSSVTTINIADRAMADKKE